MKMEDFPELGNGSRVRVNYKEASYEGFGGGFNLYLNAIQVLEHVEISGGTADDYGFGEEEDSPAAQAQTQTAANTEDDDPPF
jgi:hypothetical protein